jgi:nitrile hydratase
MNGGHDLGGCHGHGPVIAEADEPVFHAEWERRIFALTLAMGAAGRWNLDMSRFARENQPPGDYLTSSYYQNWLSGLVALLRQAGLADQQEITSGRPGPGRAEAVRVLKADAVGSALAKGGPTARDLADAPQFKPGDKVTVHNINSRGHTRAPRYVRGHTGTVIRDHGGHVFPDAHAAGRGEAPQYLYTVEFSAPELWGDQAEPGSTICVDLWQSYLSRSDLG